MSTVPQAEGDGAHPVKSWRDVLPVHPAADLFPLMTPDELKTLGEDIKKNGLRSDIILWLGGDDQPHQLLDGRNRLDAMEAAGILHVDGRQLVMTLADGRPHLVRPYLVPTMGVQGVNPYDYVVSANIYRRHLTAEQKRELIAKVLKARPGQSNLQIAKQVKADDKTVAFVRKELEARSEIPNVETRTDTKRRSQPAAKKKRRHNDFLTNGARTDCPKCDGTGLAQYQARHHCSGEPYGPPAKAPRDNCHPGSWECDAGVWKRLRDSPEPQPASAPAAEKEKQAAQFVTARWDRNDSAVTIANIILAALKYEPHHSPDINHLRHALENLVSPQGTKAAPSDGIPDFLRRTARARSPAGSSR
jgi:hypothetical protein